jgi:hypothetical protein
MHEMNAPLDNNKNTAIISLAWPFATARAPEKIWSFLKKIGLIKNVNFRIGHAAMLIAKKHELFYYDLGRYISPLGYGRVRSKETDPKLAIETIPIWNKKGELENLSSIFQELEDKKKATHGDGPLYASINYAVEVSKSLIYLKNLQKEGLQKYGALKKNKTNCGKVVAKAILKGLDENSITYKKINNPNTYSQTPYFNVLAASSSGDFVIWENGSEKWEKVVISDALSDLFRKGLESFYTKKAKFLPADSIVGQNYPPLTIPKNIKETATYLGGIGEGAWHELILNSETEVCMKRYFYSGEFEFENTYIVNTTWTNYLKNNSATLVHNSHNLWITLMNTETNEKLKFFAVNCAEEWKM